MALTIVREPLRKGRLSTRLFQTLVSGKTGQSGAPGSGWAAAGAARATGTRRASVARRSVTVSLSAGQATR